MTGVYQDITLVSGATTITLPAEMEWIDRRSRNLVAQNIEVATSGARIIEEFKQIDGFPVTLVAKGDGDTWVGQAEVDALMVLADDPLVAPMTLTYNDGTVVSVRFRYEGGTPAVESAPLIAMFPMSDTTAYVLTLRLMQASA